MNISEFRSIMKEESLKESQAKEAAPVPLRDGETYQDRERIDGILDRHWRGRGAWLRGENEHDKKQFIYGEVTPMGARQLIHFLGLKGISADKEEKGEDPIIFYDLGSGAGRLVMQLYLEKVVSVSIGVELSIPRHELAVQKWESLRETSGLGPEDTVCKVLEKDRVQLWNKDILETDFSDATHLYLSSLCFPKELTNSIAELIMETYQRSKKLKVVASLSDLPPFETGENEHLWKKSYEMIQMTWGFSTAKVYKYIGE